MVGDVYDGAHCNGGRPLSWRKPDQAYDAEAESIRGNISRCQEFFDPFLQPLPLRTENETGKLRAVVSVFSSVVSPTEWMSWLHSQQQIYITTCYHL